MEILAVVLAVAGLGVGYGGSTYVYKKNNAANEDRAAKELAKAKKEAEKLVQVAREDAARIAEEARKDEKLRRGELKDLESVSSSARRLSIRNSMNSIGAPRTCARARMKWTS